MSISAPFPHNAVSAVLIYSSDPKVDCGDWKDRFVRYVAESPALAFYLRVFTSSQTRECLEWFHGEADRFALILWDVAARVPPKEIEALLDRLEQTPLVVAARYRSDSIGRGVTFLRRIGGQLRGHIRKIIKLPSDPHAPCLGIRRDSISQEFFVSLRDPASCWPTAIYREARRRRTPLFEIPVMWIG